MLTMVSASIVPCPRYDILISDLNLLNGNTRNRRDKSYKKKAPNGNKGDKIVTKEASLVKGWLMRLRVFYRQRT